VSGLLLNLPPELLDAIAVRIVDLLEERGAMARELPGPYVDVDEAAAILRAKPQRVYDLVCAGKLQRRGDGRRLLLRRDEVIAYVDGGGAEA
jgi:hypothetical protein